MLEDEQDKALKIKKMTGMEMFDTVPNQYDKKVHEGTWILKRKGHEAVRAKNIEKEPQGPKM